MCSDTVREQSLLRLGCCILSSAGTGEFTVLNHLEFEAPGMVAWFKDPAFESLSMETEN